MTMTFNSILKSFVTVLGAYPGSDLAAAILIRFGPAFMLLYAQLILSLNCIVKCSVSLHQKLRFLSDSFISCTNIAVSYRFSVTFPMRLWSRVAFCASAP